MTGQVITRAFNLQEHRYHRSLAPGGIEHIKNGWIFEMITRYIDLYFFDHLHHRNNYSLLIKLARWNSIDGIAHHNWWISRIENNDGLTMLGTSYHLQRSGGGFGKLVNVLARSWPRRKTGNGTHHFGIEYWRHTTDGVDQGGGSLPSTSDHINIGPIQIGSCINRWHNIRATCGRGQVDSNASGFSQRVC